MEEKKEIKISDKDSEPKPIKKNEKEKTKTMKKTMVKTLEDDLKTFTDELKKREFYYYRTGLEKSQSELAGVGDEIAVFKEKIEDYGHNAEKFDASELGSFHESFENIKGEINSMNILWDHIKLCQEKFEGYMKTKWLETHPYDMEEEVKRLQIATEDIKVDRKCNAYVGLMDDIKSWLQFLPLIAELRHEAMRERHWTALKKEIEQDFEVDDKLTLKDVYVLNLNKQSEAVEEITDQARQEAKMEKTLSKLEEIYSRMEFELHQHKNTEVYLLKMSEEDFEQLEESQVNANALLSSRFISTFEDKCNYWQTSLVGIAEVYQTLSEVLRSWSFLENLFIHSEEVKKELPNESDQFIGIDKEVKGILADGKKMIKPLDFCNQDNIMTRLEEVQKLLNSCEKALNGFIDWKRRSFPRFYFVSTTDLLDILSNGNDPSKVMTYIPKIFQAINTLCLEVDGDRPTATGFESCVGQEEVKFDSPLKLSGKVESYLTHVIDKMRGTLKAICDKSNKDMPNMERKDWLLQDPSQITLLVSLMDWVNRVEQGMKTNSLPKCLETQKEMLLGLIEIVKGDIEKNVRTKIMSMITLDTHSRDIIEKLVNTGVNAPEEFQWQSQLRAYWDQEKDDCSLMITDTQFWYGYEYLGNGTRLVVTPLTERMYITATQALHLKMGCAPAGPAGAGKTETTKDLASAMGKACYVFNCSDQMDYLGMAGIFKGLASSGSWGCFDEFNRIVPEVLSMCSVQFKSITDAIRQGVK